MHIYTGGECDGCRRGRLEDRGVPPLCLLPWHVRRRHSRRQQSLHGIWCKGLEFGLNGLGFRVTLLKYSEGKSSGCGEGSPVAWYLLALHHACWPTILKLTCWVCCTEPIRQFWSGKCPGSPNWSVQKTETQFEGCLLSASSRETAVERQGNIWTVSRGFT